MTISDESKSLLLRAATVTARERLEEQLLISAKNADLFDVANTAVSRVRAVMEGWRKHSPHALRLAADDIEAILEVYDAAIKEQIK